MITILLELTLFILALAFVIDLFINFRITKSIFNRFTSKAEEIASEIRDPKADAEAALRTARASQQDAIGLRKKLLVDIAALRNKIKKATLNVEKFEDLAKLAGKAQNAEDVRTALTQKNNAVSALDGLNKQLASLQKQEDDLEKVIIDSKALIEKIESEKDLIVTTIKTNQFKAEVSTVLRDNAGKANSILEQLQADSARYQAEADAADELAGESRTLDQKYAVQASVSDDDISKYLAKQ
jgi:phage shock protein A